MTNGATGLEQCLRLGAVRRCGGGIRLGGKRLPKPRYGDHGELFAHSQAEAKGVLPI